MQPKDAVEFAKMGLDELNARLTQQTQPPFNWSIEDIVRKFFSDQGFQFNEDGIKQVIASCKGGSAQPVSQSAAQEASQE